MEKIVSLAKRRGFVFPGSEIYGGLAGFYDFGPLGVELKFNIKQEWWRRFVIQREDMFGIASSILMHRKVWETSGHVQSFIDPMVDCRACKSRFRADKVDTTAACPVCGANDFTEVRPFNTMFRTYVGPTEDTAAETFLRPETAQGMFVNFKNILDTMHPKLPFGLAQIGKAFRNEITPGNFIFRTREFEQMEIEYFIRPEGWEDVFGYWLKEMHAWLEFLEIRGVSDREVPSKDRAHYSCRTVDLDYDFPFGREELFGLAYRTEFDLKNHAAASGVPLEYYDETKRERFTPHVIEPTFGVERTVLALLVSAYHEEDERILLKLHPRLAPYKVAVFPLLANKTELVEKAREIFGSLKSRFAAAWDDRGNIGKRYYAQDEIGTPWCVTVDFQTLEDGTVTVRDRDSTHQERVAAADLAAYVQEKLG
ncbi:MAG: glycine--tRNA ligase [Candidatus Sungbacteria bacterium]|uniref:glycine--tRNA ligase n=1 Tax=Candidatus Sungiibacteriota bacterium TaxID=2750080 RepID=A0A932YVB4_9BACT|nr:glycine--tRNA ligase [Candidatus Sungbacteria bacterium]